MPTILIVDDQQIDREQAQRCLKPLGDLKVLTAENGSQALDVIERDAPDLVLTDLRMPGMDGLELVSRAQEDFPLLPIILMSSKGNEQIVLKALKAGAASYVSKNEIQRTLVDTVEQVLALVESSRKRGKVLSSLSYNESEFRLENDLGLISPLVGFLQEDLKRLRFADEGVRTQIGMALMEAMSNAMIHGNLEVSSELRKEDKNRYYKLIKTRRNEAPYSERRVVCRAKECAESVTYVIVDEGPGFDPASLPDPSAPENMDRVFGRGILLIRTFMDHVEFNDLGNQITIAKHAPAS